MSCGWMGREWGGDMAEKPILFNTPMVRAILEDRKNTTRRVVKDPYYIDDEQASRVSGLAIHKGTNITHGMPYEDQLFSPGDILWVRETWMAVKKYGKVPEYYYRADVDQTSGYKPPDALKWHPSIHMPREAARIFLRVTDVRVERLQEMHAEDSLREGVKRHLEGCLNGEAPLKPFADLWDSTIKSADRDRYGWAANPWVFRVEFERCEKPEEG